MSQPYEYTITNDSLTVIVDGEPITVAKGTVNFDPLCAALMSEAWDDVPNHITVAKAIEVWSDGDIVVEGDTVKIADQELPPVLAARVAKMASAGEDVGPIRAFWQRCQRHPKPDSLKQLWAFLQHNNIPLTEDGCFLAYKSVTRDFKDHHTRRVDNKVGAKIPRLKWSEVDTNPNNHCSSGYHVGARGYTAHFGSDSKHIVCKVAPEDVSSVPNDYNAMKLRCVWYEITGHHGGVLPSTSTGADKAKTPKAKTPKASGGKSVRTAKPGALRVARLGDKPIYTPADWAGFATLDEATLLTKPLDLLRGYGANSLKIAGCSKIPGGKRALVARIIEVRDGEGN